MSIKSVDLLQSEFGTLLLRALAGLQFGSVEIVVHDGRVVHLERRERVRLDPARLPHDRRPHHDTGPDRTTGGPAPRHEPRETSE
jgi:hypothetical protein